MKLSVPSALRRGMSCHQEMGLAPAFSSAKMRKSVEERAPCGAKGGKEREREREKGREVGGGGGRGAKGSALFRSQLFFFAWLAAVVLSLSLFSTLSFPFSISLSYLLDLAVRAGVDGRGADGDAGATRGVGEGLIEIFDDYFFPT